MNALIISALLGVVMMFSGIFIKRKMPVKHIAGAGMLLLLAVNFLEMNGHRLFPIDASAFLSFSQYALAFNGVAIFCTLIYLIVTGDVMQKVGNYYAEYFAIFFFILCGIFLMSSFTSLLTLFIGIEIISIPLYILTGADKKNLKSNEAALKYFLMGSFSTGILLLGIAMLYGAQGTFSLDLLKMPATSHPHLLTAGILLLLFSLSFKVSVAPFHFWTPDVYDGAPTVFTSYMATVVKAGMFIGFIRLFQGAFGFALPQWQIWVAVMIAATIFVGNITAVFQQSVKRMLAYSSIAQAGFMLMAILAGSDAGMEGLFLYAAAYSLATIGIFAVLSKMVDYSYEGFNGLAKRQPLVAFTTTICLLSLAGIPLTAGFLGKLYMLKALVMAGNYLWLVIVAIVMAAVSVYYYFKVIQAMYFKEGNADMYDITPVEKYALVFISVLLVLIGLFPGVLLKYLYF